MTGLPERLATVMARHATEPFSLVVSEGVVAWLTFSVADVHPDVHEELVGLGFVEPDGQVTAPGHWARSIVTAEDTPLIVVRHTGAGVERAAHLFVDDGLVAALDERRVVDGSDERRWGYVSVADLPSTICRLWQLAPHSGEQGTRTVRLGDLVNEARSPQGRVALASLSVADTVVIDLALDAVRGPQLIRMPGTHRDADSAGADAMVALDPLTSANVMHLVTDVLYAG